MAASSASTVFSQSQVSEAARAQPAATAGTSHHPYQELDNKLIQDIENGLKSFEFYLSSTKRRKMIVIFASVAGSALEQSGSSTSAQDSAGTSNALIQALQHLDTILQTTDLTDTQEYGFAKYQAKVEGLPRHILEIQESDNPTQFSGSREVWNLIGLAAAASKEVYNDFEKVDVPWKHEEINYSNFKPTIISVVESQNRRVLTVSIRGSVTKRDWMVNVNGMQVRSRKLLDGTNTWHRGLLVVAESMQKTVVNKIASMKMSDSIGPADELLFTGHSAGGAVAQLFYVMGMTEGHKMSEVVSEFNSVHCITFGCPPVSNSPILRPDLPFYQSGQFLNIINEGDPVPLAQDEYIKSLLDVYALSEYDLEERYPKGFHVPPPIFRVSGHPIVLRDVDPDHMGTPSWKAVSVDACFVERKLFGNPILHLMRHYLERVEALEKQVQHQQEDISDAEGPEDNAVEAFLMPAIGDGEDFENADDEEPPAVEDAIRSANKEYN